jgi:hypothetical protein
MFKIDVDPSTLEFWDVVSTPWLYELIELENSMELDGDYIDLKPMKKMICVKYFGEEFTRKYIEEYSLNHDAYQMHVRVKRFIASLVDAM